MKKINGKQQTFSHRERKILKLMAEGYSDNEVAEDLYMSIKGVEECQANLMKKLNLQDISSVIDYALGKRWISLYEILESRFSKSRHEPL